MSSVKPVGLMILTFVLFLPSLALAGAVDLPATGQTTCYDQAGAVISCDGTGQDGDIRAGAPWPSPRFTVGTGAEVDCVTDNLTGLMWVKIPSSTVMLWAAAVNSANNLNLCGYTDWRLPNVNELESLMNTDVPNSADWLNTQGFSNVLADRPYWTSTSQFGPVDGGVWMGDMYRGSIYADYKVPEPYHMWPVRSGDGSMTDAPSKVWKTGQTMSYATGDDGDIEAGVAWPSPRFTVNGDCVTDGLTGLMWARVTNLSGLINWQQALNYAGNFTLCNYSDWRLPTRKELMSLVDRSGYLPDALPLGHPFITGYDTLYWSSTTHAGFDALLTDRAWILDLQGGAWMYQPKTYNTTLAWPVRSGQVGSVLLSNAPSGDQRFPWADYNEVTGEFLVLWQDKRNGASDDIYGVRLDQSGHRVGSDFAVSTASGHQQRVLVKAGGGGYLAVWHDLRNQVANGADIYGAWIAGDGTVGAEMAICACSSDQWNPVAGYDPASDSFFVVWLDARGSSNNQTGNVNDNFDLYGAVIPAGGSGSITAFPVVTAINGQRGPQIGYDYGSGQYYMAWNDRRGGLSVGYDIYGSRVTTSGLLLDGSGVLLSGASGNQFRPTVLDRRPSAGINNHLIAWTDYRAGAQADVYGIQIDGSGVILGSDIVISTNGADQANIVADVDWINTKKALVGWIDQRNGTDFDIYSSAIDQAGGVGGDKTLVGQSIGVSGDQRSQVMTYATDGLTDHGFLTVWMDRRNGTDYDIWGVKVWP